MKGEPMSKCKDCKYAEDSNYKISNIECCSCSLTRRVMNANAESNCNCFNRDLSEYDICYNCKYYIGGGDWGLFCSHKDMYHHLGKFSDEPCERYERRTDNRCSAELMKLPSAEPEQQWIPCSERMPDEHEWLGTKEFGTTISDEVYVTFENPKGERFCKHLSFQNRSLSDYDQHTIDVFYKGSKPIAWMPLPEPYQVD